MGLFGKKGAPAKTNEPAAVAQNAPLDNLTKVLDESVWESVLEDLKANKQFTMRDASGTKYVSFLLETSQFGGLAGKDAKKDESKGSIIEAIKTGRIKTYLKIEMLAEGIIIIIPDKNTVENMDEFNLFNNSTYVLCTISPEGVVTTVTENGTDDDPDDPEITVDFNTIKNLVRSGGDIGVLFAHKQGAFVAESAEDDDVEELEEDPEESGPVPSSVSPEMQRQISQQIIQQAQPAPQPVQQMPQPVQQTIPQPVQQMPQQVMQQPAYDPQQQMIQQQQMLMQQQQLQQQMMMQQMPAEDLNDVVSDDAVDMNDDDIMDPVQASNPAYNQPVDMYEEDQGGYDAYEDITQDVVQDWVVRKFYSDDLGLEVSTQPFDAEFIHGNEYVPFNENRGEGWLNEYLSNLAKDANTHMERMHTENLFRMRERYMRLIQGQCVNIAKTLDASNETTLYGKIKLAIETNKEDNMKNISQAVSEKRAQLEAAWEDKLQQEAQSAALAARNNYIEKNGPKHEQDLKYLEILEKNEIEVDYNNAIRAMNEDRRAEATKLLDIAINETLKQMSDVYMGVMERESQEYAKYQQQMLKFIDDNRKDEKARIEALAEENRQVKKANEVRGEYISKIKTLAADFEMKKTVLQADIEKMRREHEADLKTYESEYTAKYETERNRANALQEQLSGLMDQINTMEERKNKEIEDRINMIKAENAQSAASVQQVIASSKNTSRVALILAGCSIFVGLFVGFLLGSNRASANTLPENETDTTIVMENTSDAQTVDEAIEEVNED